MNDQKWTPESVTNLRANSRRRCTFVQATTSVDKDKRMQQLSAYHIGKDWLDSDAFCELQPIIANGKRGAQKLDSGKTGEINAGRIDPREL